MNLPILYHKAKGGDLRQWRTWADGDTIYTEYGQVGGKLQVSQKIAEPKNIGRSNETSPGQQAALEAKSLWQYKVDRKYSETTEGAQEQLPLPMLAHSFKGTKRKKFTYPADIQPKLDGVRCLAELDNDGNVALTSRQGKPWNIPHIADQLAKWLPPGMTLDGELYVHGESCQRITSWSKSANPNGKSYKQESLQLVYHVYDVPSCRGDDSLIWSERFINLQDVTESPNVKRVGAKQVCDEVEMWQAYAEFTTDGYEGAILRGRNGKYLWGYRSADLLKVKEFQDAEFEVIDATEGIGAAKGCILFICRNDLTDGTFKCTMKATVSKRRRMYEERDSYIGQMLTVRFFDRTDDDIPRFPVGIVFRDEIDLPKKGR